MINTASTYKGGGVQVAYSFIEECKNHPEHDYAVILGEKLTGLIDPDTFPNNFTFYRLGYRPATRLMRLRSPSKDLAKIEAVVQPDVVFTTSGPAYWKSEAPHLMGFNLGHFMYPESPFYDQISFFKRLKWKIKGRVLKYFFRREADAYVVQTEDIRDRLKSWVNHEAVYTVSNTAGRQYFTNGQILKKLPERKKDEFRFLILSSWYPHKNLSVLNRVIPELIRRGEKNIQFIITVPVDEIDTYFTREAQQCIVNMGVIPPVEAPSLYRECDAMFLPTLLECFSASYAEAMVTERPIATSDLGFARTVCGDAAIYFDPVNHKEIADQLIRLSKDKSLRESLIQKGRDQFNTFLTAERRCRAYLNICESLMHGKN